MNGANAQGIYDNRSSAVTIINNTKVSGNIGLYGTQSFTVTSSQQTSGNLVMNGVVYASFSNTSLGGNLSASSCGSVQIDTNTINGNVAFVNDQVVKLTNNTIHGTLTFTTDPNCYQANNTVSGTTSGTCTLPTAPGCARRASGAAAVPAATTGSWLPAMPAARRPAGAAGAVGR